MSTLDPYAPAPPPHVGPPAGFVDAGSVLPPPRRRPRGLVVALVAAGTVVVLAAAGAGALAVRRLVVGAPDRIVQLVPAEAVAYAHVNLQPSAGNLVGLVSLADRLEEAAGEPLLDADRLAREVADDAPVWAEDVEPWLGRQAGAFSLAPPAGGAPGDAEAAALVLVTDRAAATAFVEEHVGTAGPWDAGTGARGWALEGDDGAVLAVTDDLLLVGTPGAVGSALSASSRSGSGASLADDAGYSDLVEALPSSVATAWVDVERASGVAADLGQGLPGGLDQVTVSEVALGLSLGAGAADVTVVARPTAAAEALPGVAVAELADLPAGGLAYLRLPDAGASLSRALDTADQAAAGSGEPLPSTEADEVLAAFGTDVGTVTGWLGDVVAVVAYDPSRAEDNAGVEVRAAVSDPAAAADLLDAATADLPPDAGLTVGPGSLSSGSAELSAGSTGLTLRAGTLPDGTLGDDAAWADAVDGLPGEPVAYVDVRAVVGAVAALAADSADLPDEDRQALDVLAAFDRLVVTTERTDDGLERSRVRLSWGRPLQPLDLDVEQNLPDVDVGLLGDAVLGGAPGGDLGGGLDGAALEPGLEPGFDGSGATTYGDDPALDALWDACAGGDGRACDDLYYASPVGSGYEAFAVTCGGRTEEATSGCASDG